MTQFYLNLWKDYPPVTRLIMQKIMQQVLHPADPMAALKTLELVDGLAQKCNFWNIKCNISDEAAIVSHDAIFGG